MKVLKKIFFVFGCALIFLLSAALSCVLRARYSSVPKQKAEFAYMYAANLEQYSFLQYNQAGPEQGRESLLQYVQLLQRIRDEHIEFPPNTLHRDFGLTYLRLYRLESSAGNSAEAAGYLKASQTEWAALGWKAEDVSPEALTKLIAKRESNEARIYNDIGLQVPAAQAKQVESKVNRQ